MGPPPIEALPAECSAAATLPRVEQRFPLRRAWWAVPFVAPLAPGRTEALVDDEGLRVHMGLLGRARVTHDRIAAVGRMRWPWWGGAGVRIARGTVAFMASAGEAVAIELSEPVSVRAPLPWRARRLVIGVEDVEGLIAALAARRP